MDYMRIKINGKTIVPKSINIEITLPVGSIDHKAILNDMKNPKPFLIEIDGFSYMLVSGYQSGFFKDELGRKIKIDFVGD